jgi:hypothetical protein
MVGYKFKAYNSYSHAMPEEIIDSPARHVSHVMSKTPSGLPSGIAIFHLARCSSAYLRGMGGVIDQMSDARGCDKHPQRAVR